MSTKQTGGPAFPETKEQHAWFPGMTLRDYFAAKAMQGLLQVCEAHAPQGLLYTPDIVARNSYAIADAMLKARDA